MRRMPGAPFRVDRDWFCNAEDEAHPGGCRRLLTSGVGSNGKPVWKCLVHGQRDITQAATKK